MKTADPTPDPTFCTMADLVAWLRRAPSGTRLEAGELARILDAVADEAPEPRDNVDAGEHGPDHWTWRERLWTVPAETRLGVVEVCEALGRAKSWVYERTGPSAEHPIPHRKLDGVNVFTAGEVRAWIRDQEEVVHGGPMHSTDAERRGLYAV